MNTHADKAQEKKSQSVTSVVSKKQSGRESTFQFVDNFHEAIVQRKLQELAINSPQAKQAAQLQVIANHHSIQQQHPVQKRVNNTGLPDNLKTGIENLSGCSMDDVKVHRNSDKPAQLQAHAYAQGTDIHLGPGQEKHLPHEVWHVVQQKQRRVKPTMQMKDKVNVNDDVYLENEADKMGAKALQSNVQQMTDVGYEPELGTIPESILQAQFDVTDDERMIGEKVIVSVDDCDEYGETGVIERYSISETGMWSVRMDISHDLVRFPYENLSLVTNESEHIETDAVKSRMPDESVYRVYKSRNGADDWKRVVLKKQEDGSLLDKDGVTYRLLNIANGTDVPFVSKEAEKQDSRPTEEFVEFLSNYGFSLLGSGTIQDRLHLAVVSAQKSHIDELIVHLHVDQNGKWYTSNIRQGGLNELLLTSDSVEVIDRYGGHPNKDKYAMRDGKPYTFAELQRDTSYPTKDFVFKGTFIKDDGHYQNSHVNARMYHIDAEGKKHRTVGPVSPVYHLSMEQESLKFHFNERTTMLSLVFDLIELHKNMLAEASDILSIKASVRGSQVYEMRGGDLLELNKEKDLAIFADIVQNHRNRVIQNLKDIHKRLEAPVDGCLSPRPPLSPTHYPSVQSPEHK